jgi:hypothetical protein
MTAPFRLDGWTFSSSAFDVLGEVAGYNAHEARGRWARAGSEATERQSYVFSEASIRGMFGPRGVEALLAAELAERVDGGLQMLRMDGSIEWYGELADKRRRAGQARASNARRDERGRLLPASTPSTPPAHAGVLDQRTPSVQPSQPSAPDLVPDPVQSGTHTPRAIGGSWARWKGWHDFMLAAHDRLRRPTAKRAAIKPNTPDLAKHPNERAMLAVRAVPPRGGYDDAGIDAKMRHVVLVYEAEAERLETLDYFKPAIIWDTTRADRFPRKVDTSLEEARGDSAVTRASRAGPRRAGDLIGSATPRTDHPEGDRLRELSEFNR